MSAAASRCDGCPPRTRRQGARSQKGPRSHRFDAALQSQSVEHLAPKGPQIAELVRPLRDDPVDERVPAQSRVLDAVCVCPVEDDGAPSRFWIVRTAIRDENAYRRACGGSD